MSDRKDLKIAVIGGGSTYTPELLEGLIQRSHMLKIGEVALEDIADKRLSSIGSFCSRKTEKAGAGFKISTTADLEEACAGASFIIIQIRVGGQEARHFDEMLGKKNGLIGQETTGAGGFSKAWRTIPVVLYIAKMIEKVSPNAWIINFTNPSGIITETLLRFSKLKVVGLCNIPMELRMGIADHLNVDADRVDLDYVGLNHLSWVRRITVDGVDITNMVIDALAGGYVPENIPEVQYSAAFHSALRMIPSPYLRYFYMTGEMIREQENSERTRAQEVMEIEKGLFEYYNDAKNFQKPALLHKRGGAWYSRAAVNVIGALLREKRSVEIVNAKNSGAIPGIPDDSAVEIPSFLSKKGVKPRHAGEIEEGIIGLMRQVKSYERLTIEAAMNRDYDKALLALVNNPLVRTVDKAEAVLDEIRNYNI
ncbi:MAG: 6-phospho-beta-glucosidase [Deltaproteobacteria bacterium]|nr:6-phospho-beta-glucosidase [Deltaproteobacteria bacterium]